MRCGEAATVPLRHAKARALQSSVPEQTGGATGVDVVVLCSPEVLRFYLRRRSIRRAATIKEKHQRARRNTSVTAKGTLHSSGTYRQLYSSESTRSATLGGELRVRGATEAVEMIPPSLPSWKAPHSSRMTWRFA